MSATFKINGGDEENRTPDPLLARQVLSQLSYAPMFLLDLFVYNFVIPSSFRSMYVYVLSPSFASSVLVLSENLGAITTANV